MVQFALSSCLFCFCCFHLEAQLLKIHPPQNTKQISHIFCLSLQRMLNCHIFHLHYDYPSYFILYLAGANNIKDSHFHSSLTQESFGEANYWFMRQKALEINLREIRAASVYVSLFWLLCKQLAFPCCYCWVQLSWKYRAVTESVEIVFSGDHEREVIGICGYTIIAVIICRPCFFVFCRAFSHNYLTRSPAQRGRAIV